MVVDDLSTASAVLVVIADSSNNSSDNSKITYRYQCTRFILQKIIVKYMKGGRNIGSALLASHKHF